MPDYAHATIGGAHDRASHLNVSVLRLPWNITDWDLVTAYLRFRKAVFIDDLKWDLSEVHGIEFEQYDTFDTVYIVAHAGREVLGGARLKRTDCRHGTGNLSYSYMIRDACRNLLPGMPTNLCFSPPPVDKSIWELTRLATIRDPKMGQAVLRAANRFLHSIQARTCLFLGPPAFMRMARRMGFDPIAMGPVTGNHDGRFVAFECAVVPPRDIASPASNLRAIPNEPVAEPV